MKSKNLLAVLLACVLSTGIVACGGSEQSVPGGTSDVSVAPSGSEQEQVSSSETQTSVIKELKAVEEEVDMKIGVETAHTSFYKLTGFKSLTAKQKKVTITSSNEEIVKVNKSTLEAVALGEAEITVVSQADETKSCTFKITVSDCFFDRKITSISSSWDVSKEMDAENPSIKVDTDLGSGIYIRNSDGLKLYVETEITIHEVLSTEAWPKFGLVASTADYTTDTTNNKVYFFLNAEMVNETNWVNYGVCEVSNEAGWAWNPGIANNVARHNDAIYTAATPVTYNTSFKLGMIRDEFNMHFYVNGNYVKSAQILDTLFGNYNAETETYSTPAKALAGFFSFNSTVTFSNYKFVSDAATVDGMIAAITPSYCDWAED